MLMKTKTKQTKAPSESRAVGHPEKADSAKGKGLSQQPPGHSFAASETPIQGFFEEWSEVWDTVTETASKIGSWLGLTKAKLPATEVEAAKAWALESRIGQEAIQQLQEELGLEQTGLYDETTIQAVYARQVQINEGRENKIPEDGIADRAFFRRLGLVFTEQIVPAGISSEFFKQFFGKDGEPKAAFARGVTIGVYTHYDKQDGTNKTFHRVAHPWAAKEQAIYVDKSGNLSLGKAIAIQDTGDVIEKVQSISRGLYGLYALGVYYGWCKYVPGSTAANPPVFTQVKNLGVFAHGMQYGLGLDANGSYKDGVTAHTPELSAYRDTEANLSSFVKGLKGGISNDVRMHLFSCNAAREYDPDNPFSYKYDKDGNKIKGKNGKWLKSFGGTNLYHEEGVERGGDNSFAALLAAELGEEASVYGHLVPGHTTRNYASVVFGQDAEGQGQMHLFDKMYDNAFIVEQLTGLGIPEADQAKVRSPLRKMMWDHFVAAVGNKGSKRIGTQIGAEMFVHPANAREILQQDFVDHWLTKARIRELKKEI